MSPHISELIAKFNGNVDSALPYNKVVYQKTDKAKLIEKDDTSENIVPAVQSDDVEVADEVRISTRARRTYELDRYSKNAMLIFEGNSSHTFDAEDDSSDDEYNMADKLKQTFENYRFQVEIHRNMNDDEIARTCDQFFQQDFTEYGCVAVILLAKTKDGIVESSHTTNTEFGVIRHLTDLLPPTLEGKPQIYIVQTEGYLVVPRARVWSRVPQDNLEFRLTVPVVSAPDFRGSRSKVCCLLEHFQEKLNLMGDELDLHTLIQDSVNEFTRKWQLYGTDEVAVYSSLSKELRLARRSEILERPA